MKVSLVCVGKPRGPVADAIAEYERRLGHYFRFQAVEVREERFHGQPVPKLVAEEGERILARVPAGDQLVALHRPGREWSSEELARILQEVAIAGTSGMSFVIGGAYGLSDEVLRHASHQLSLSAMTLPHELARLILAEQIYRAGTINRGEPYHKGAPS